jgi:hypothetical protein
MSGSYKAAGALAALALGACAHTAGMAHHIPGGRAGQPESWAENSVTASRPAQAVTVTPGLGGRAGQPSGWPENLGGVGSEQAPRRATAAYVGGRAAQPGSWPEQLVPNEQRLNAIATLPRSSAE